MPISFFFGDKVYRDWVDITPTEAYELFLKDPDSFKTSPASPVDYLKAYREVSNQSKNILCVTVSAKLSTAYNIAKLAGEQAMTEFPATSVEVLDSQTATAAEGFIALAAARAAAEGKSLAEVVKTAEEMRDRVTFVLFLDTIRHVYRSGRIPKIASQVGALLNVKPILTASSGAIKFIGAVRSRERGMDRLLKIMRAKVGQRRVHVAVLHAYALDEAEKLKERVSSEFDCAELWLTEFSPLMGYACGTGTVGFSFYPED